VKLKEKYLPVQVWLRVLGESPNTSTSTECYISVNKLVYFTSRFLSLWEKRQEPAKREVVRTMHSRFQRHRQLWWLARCAPCVVWCH